MNLGFLLRFFLFSTLSFSASYSWAENFSGYIERTERGIFLVIDSPAKAGRLSLQSSSTRTLIQIGRLNTGDFLAASGSVDSEQNIAFVNSIDYVGLKKLLGRWKTSNGQLFEFASFQDLYIYKSRPVATSVFRYSAAPSNGDSWTLLLSDSHKKRTLIANVTFGRANASLKLIDSETGAIAETLRLVRQGANSAEASQPHKP